MPQLLKNWTQPLSIAMLKTASYPDFVKSAGDINPERLEKLGDGNFALILMEPSGSTRLYPTYDKASTWISGQHLADTYVGMPKKAAAMAAYNILGAAEVFAVDVPEVLRKIASQLPSMQHSFTRYFAGSKADEQLSSFDQQPVKEASAGESTVIDGRVFSISNPSDLFSAEQWFDRNHFSMSSSEKYKMANFIAEKRNLIPEKIASGVYRSPEVTKVAGLNSINPNFYNEMIRRASMAPKYAANFAKIAENSKAFFAAGIGSAIDSIERLDKAAGLERQYGVTIHSALETVAVHTPSLEEKTASDLSGYASAGHVIDDSEESASCRPVTYEQVKMAAASNHEALSFVGPTLLEKLSQSTVVTFNGLPASMRRLILTRLGSL